MCPSVPISVPISATLYGGQELTAPIDREWENPKGVPISAILFGGQELTAPIDPDMETW